MKKKTHEEFIKEVFALVGNEFEVIEKYQSSKVMEKFKHTSCKHVFYKLPNDFLITPICPNCNLHDKFEIKVQKMHGNNYEILGRYVNNRTPVKTKHNICGYVWDAHPNLLIAKTKKDKVYCPFCSGTIKLTNRMFIERVFDLVGDEYVVLEEYKNNKTKLKIRHNTQECAHEYYVSPNSFLSHNSRCPKCFGNIKRTTEEFKKIVFELEGENYKVLGEYINCATPLKMQHTKCGNEFMVRPDKFTGINQRCPFCSNNSIGELKISDFLKKKNIFHITQYRFNDCRNILSLPFDFAIFEEDKLKILIEYDGKQHFIPNEFFGGEIGFERTKQNDSIKNQYCKDNNIPFYRIPYWKLKDIELILNKLIHNDPIIVDENFIIQ